MRASNTQINLLKTLPMPIRAWVPRHSLQWQPYLVVEISILIGVNLGPSGFTGKGEWERRGDTETELELQIKSILELSTTSGLYCHFGEKCRVTSGKSREREGNWQTWLLLVIFSHDQLILVLLLDLCLEYARSTKRTCLYDFVPLYSVKKTYNRKER